MISVSLTRIKTRDGIILDGIIREPEKKSGVALIWLHGLCSRFYSSQTMTQEISNACLKKNIAYLKFNTRGHDMIERTPNDQTYQGGGFETFTDCLHDIRAMILCARKQGYTKVVLAGHSTGANKALYYAYKKRDPLVKGVALLAPVSDIAGAKKMEGAQTLQRGINTARALQKQGKNKTALMPLEYGIISAQRYLSLYTPDSAEDVFPYHNPRAQWKELKTIRTPLMVCIGVRDEFLDRSAKELVNIFAKHAPSTKSFSGVIIKRADHGFKRAEAALAKELVHWIQRDVV